MPLSLPTVGGDAGVWGTELNAILTTLDNRTGAALDVRAYLPGGYVSDGSVDYSAQLETARAAAHGIGELVIPAGFTIKGALTLQTGDWLRVDGTLIGTASPAITNASTSIVRGSGVVQAGSTHAMTPASGIAAWIVTGITIDGNTTQNGIYGAGNTNVSYDDFRIVGCRFRNCAQAIRFAPSARYAVIADNTFEATTQGMQIYRGHYVQVTRNRFLGSITNYNCITFTASTSQTFTWGYGVQITDNIIESSGRMGIEVANDTANGVHYRTVVARNAIDSTASRCISLLSEFGVCADNQCSNASNDAIEIAQQGALVIGNTIRSCPSNAGIVLNNGPRSVIIGNHVRDCKYAVGLNNGGTAVETSSRDVRIIGNEFEDITTQYINCGTISGAAIDYAGLLVQGNLFQWGLDQAGPTFLNLSAMASTEYRAIRIINNTFLCSVTGTPVTMTNWYGIYLGGTNQFPGSEISGNHFASRTAAPMGRPFDLGVNTSATSNSYYQVRILNNRFSNVGQLAQFTGGGGAYFWGNVNDGSTTTSMPAWAMQGGRVLAGSATYDWPSIANGASATTTVSVPGAVIGDYAQASMSISLAGLQLTAYVSAADTVTAVMDNATGGAVNLASATLNVLVMSAS